MIWQHTNLSSLLAWRVIWKKGLTIYGHTSSTNINQHFIRVIISNFTFQFDKIIKLELSIISVSQQNFYLLPVLLLSELESILSMSFKLNLIHVIRKLYVWTTLHIYLLKCHFLFDLPIFTFSSSSILFCHSEHLGYS